MKDETIAAMVQSLAEKLGTTADHVWEIMIAQSHVVAVKSGILIVLSLAALVAAGFLYRFAWAKHDEALAEAVDADEHRDMRSSRAARRKSEDAEGIFAISAGAAAVVAIVAGVVFAVNVGVFLSAAINPEYVALMEITSMIAAMVH